MDSTTADIISVIDLVIGTEKDVSNRREILLLVDDLLFENKSKFIISGSFAEGVRSKDSDIDFMEEILPWLICSLSDNVPTDRYTYFRMIPSPQHHGYCMLLCLDRHSVQNKFTECYEGNHYLSGSKIKYTAITQIPGFDTHGPCARCTTKTIEVESALCMRCLSWPEVANEWPLRPRPHGWPSDSLIRKIMQSSCHVVPIGVPDSPTNSLEWRISFSLAERALVHSFNRTQFIVYCILKQITKEIIGKELPNVMCSYFIKTVLFHSIETTPAALWRTQNLQECLHKSIRVLYRFVDDLFCPHYFIRDVNLFNPKVNIKNRCKLLYLLRQLLSMNLQHILSCLETFSSFVNVDHVKQISSREIEVMSDRDYEYCYHFFKQFLEWQKNFERVIFDELTVAVGTISILSSNTITHVSTFLYTLLADVIYNSHSKSPNKSQYRVNKLIERFYKLGTESDVTSGRLRLASFYLMTGNVNGCLKVIQSVLNRISPCVRVTGADLTPSYCDDYIHFMCGRGLSARQKFHSCVSMLSVYFFDNVIAPLAIRYQIWDNNSGLVPRCITGISPLIHAYFLQALCYIELRNRSKLDVTVQMMRETMTDKTLVCKDVLHNDNNLLGYILMRQGNIGDAVRYHVKSYYSKVKYQFRLPRVYSYNIAILRIMCCLRYQIHPRQRLD